MKLIVDMNLSSRWVGFLSGEGFTAAHWSDVGDVRAADCVIADWEALDQGALVTIDVAGARVRILPIRDRR